MKYDEISVVDVGCLLHLRNLQYLLRIYIVTVYEREKDREAGIEDEEGKSYFWIDFHEALLVSIHTTPTQKLAEFMENFIAAYRMVRTEMPWDIFWRFCGVKWFLEFNLNVKIIQYHENYAIW